MDLSKQQAEYWAFIIGLMIAVAIAILLIDFSIKAAILEESTRLRLIIEGERSGQKPGTADASGATNDAPDNSPLSSDVLVVDPTGMETGNGHKGDQKPSEDASNRRPQPRRPNRNRAIPGGNE